MIVHVFNGDLCFHSIGMIKNYITKTKANHYFIIFLSKDNHKNKYIEIFEKYNYTQYRVVLAQNVNNKTNSLSMLQFMTKILLINYIFRKNVLSNEAWHKFVVLWKFRKYNIFQHGANFIPFFAHLLIILRLFKSVSYCHWGYLEKSWDELTFRQRCLRVYRKIIYKKFRIINCLMEPDVELIKRDYGLNNLSLCPYNWEYKICDLNSNHNNVKPKVLMGNSIVMLENYFSSLPFLARFNNDITLTTMLVYGQNTKRVDEYIKLSNDIFGSDNHIWQEILPLDDYLSRFEEHDIYISPSRRQTGLFAVSSAVILGKKIFLSGTNYRWLSYMGVKVFRCEDISSMSFQDFSSPLTQSEQEYNRKQLLKVYDNKILAERWDSLFMRLEQGLVNRFKDFKINLKKI